MHVVVAHSRYLSGDASGENRVVDDEIDLLRSAGHEVDAWQPTPDDAAGLGLVRTGFGAIWSARAAEEMRRRIRAMRADVVHLHNLYPMLSPSVVRVAESERVGVVVTLHNYRQMCLPATFLRDGRVCEDCLGRVPWRGVVHRCYRGSTLGSAAMATSLAASRVAQSLDRVHLFLAVGEFVKRKHVEAGWEPSRIKVKPNFTRPAEVREGPGGGFLYVGRLSPEKGLAGLFAAWPEGATLRVVGDGPERSRLEAMAPASVRFEGSVPGSEVAAHIRRARALLLPSICYEGQPRVVLEAFAAGVPVIASDIGGMVDLVDPGRNGLLPAPGSRVEWRGAIDELSDDPRSLAMGAAALDRWRERYTPDVGLASLEQAYGEAVERAGGTSSP